MKTKTLLFTFFAMVTFTMSAQTDYSSYLNKAMEKLEAGDCVGAQKMYNVYKDLTGKSMPSVESLLEDCKQEKTVSVGDSIQVGNMEYQVAYVRDGGKHGLAIANRNWNSIYHYGYQTSITRKGVPTLEELRLIYANRDIIRLYDIYWSCTSCDSKGSGDPHFIIKDFSTGSEKCVNYGSNVAVILLVHRF